jgi:hypothetical protein
MPSLMMLEPKPISVTIAAITMECQRASYRQTRSLATWVFAWSFFSAWILWTLLRFLNSYLFVGHWFLEKLEINYEEKPSIGKRKDSVNIKWIFTHTNSVLFEFHLGFIDFFVGFLKVYLDSLINLMNLYIYRNFYYPNLLKRLLERLF